MKEKKNTMKVSLAVVWLLLVTGLIYICTYADIGYKNVVINEVCGYNNAVIYDTAGVCYDYIELYNPTDEIMDISGFYLSDDKDDLTKFVLPEGTLMVSGEHFLVWAGIEGENNLLKDDRLYTGFSLRAGETLYLSDAQGEIIDKVKIPSSTLDDTAYARVSIANDVWKLTKGSPGEENQIEQQEKRGKTKVAFSAEGGFYEEPFYLEMKTNKAYDIYYTLDGSTPTVESLKYEEPILIEDVSSQENRYAGRTDITLRDYMYIPTESVTKAVVVRAVAVDKKGKLGEEKIATYFVDFEEKSGFEDIPILSIITDPENLFNYENGIYVTGKLWDMHKEIPMPEELEHKKTAMANYLRRGTGWEREATLQYYDANGELLYHQQAALGIHGKSSATYNQKSFNITALPEVDGNKYIFEGMFGKKETTLMLRNGGGDCYGTKLKDVLTQELVKDRALAVTDFQPCQVFLDGEYWGLYMIQERVGESMLSNQYHVPEENIVTIKVEEVVAGEETDIQLWDDVMNFVKETDLSVAENYEKVEQMIDIQSCIDHYAFEVYVANCDSLRNNQAKWRVKKTGDGLYEDGKWRWIIYDVDSSLGGILGLTTAEVDSFADGNYWYSVLQDELFCALVKNEEFRQRFVISFMDMANYNFEAEKVLTRVDELADELMEATIASQQRFDTPDYDEQDYEIALEEITTFFSERYDYITAYVKPDFGLQGELVSVEIEETEGGKVCLNTIALKEGEGFKGKYYSDYPITLSAEPAEGYEFKGWLVSGELFLEPEVSLQLVEEEYIIMPMWEEIQ